MNTITNTIAVVTMVSLRVGQVTRASSWRTCWTNSAMLVLAMSDQCILNGRSRQHHHTRLYKDGGIGWRAAHGRAPHQPVRAGRSGGARTPNPRFWRPVLHQLSYT